MTAIEEIVGDAGDRRRGGMRPLHFDGKVGHGDTAASGGAKDQALDGVLQFADVSRPLVGDQVGERIGGQLLRPDILAFGVRPKIMIQERRDVLAPVSERRHVDADHRQAPEQLGANTPVLYRGVESRVARAENVRAALALVERGEAPLGIVYETDAKASKQVRIMGYFPANSHPPITYAIAILKASTSPDAQGLRRFLISARAKALFRKYGFIAK